MAGGHFIKHMAGTISGRWLPTREEEGLGRRVVAAQGGGQFGKEESGAGLGRRRVAPRLCELAVMLLPKMRHGYVDFFNTFLYFSSLELQI